MSAFMNVSVTVELSPDAETQLRTAYPDLPAAIPKGFLVNLFRRGILTYRELDEAVASAASRPTAC